MNQTLLVERILKMAIFWLIVIIAAYILLQMVILPKLGVST